MILIFDIHKLLWTFAKSAVSPGLLITSSLMRSKKPICMEKSHASNKEPAREQLELDSVNDRSKLGLRWLGSNKS